MTWTATERDHVIGPGRVAEISDGDEVFCCIYSGSADTAALEQMRARARLIVQAEAMLDLLQTGIELVEASDPNEEVLEFFLAPARAIIAATEGDHG